MNRTVCFSFLMTLVFAAGAASADTEPAWVFFTDRGATNISRTVAAKAASLSEPKNTGRRARLLGSAIFDERDLPVNPDYISAVEEIAGGIRTVTRYFNGVSVNLDPDGIERVKRLSFVKSVRPVAGYTLRKPVPEPGVPETFRGKRSELSYGDSYYQLSIVGATKIHSQGYLGDGIRIGVLDSGFDNLAHTAFDSVSISHTWDFLDRNDDVSGDDHGSKVLSIMAALDPGYMIGAAPHSTYLLARTEIIGPPDSADYRVEEDYWVAGLEWADSLGVDVVQSSLGYNEFVDGPSYTYADMDGETALTTIAADIAVKKGIVVVNSAGNEGDNSWYYIVAPADGKQVIAVGSVHLDGNLDPVVSSFSSRGPSSDSRMKPDFVALGENVLMVSPTGNSYTTGSGTSYSSPAVSGAAALLLQIHPDWTPAVLYDSLRVSATSAGADSLAGWGTIDAFAASGISDTTTVSAKFRSYPPYPQPVVFAGSTSLVYFPVDIPAGGKCLTIRIFTFSGENVKTIEQVPADAGSYRDRGDAPTWDGTNFTGDPVAPGVYYYTIRLAGYSECRGKIAVIR